MDYRFFYITWALVFFLLWLFLFWWRKDGRREVLLISTLFGFGGVISQFTHLEDWWRPLTLTGTPVGVEDFIIGFSIAGVTAMLWREDLPLPAPAYRRRTLLLPFMLIFLGSFYILGISSFYAAVLAYLFGIAFILFHEPRLLHNSIASGFLLFAVGMGVYFLLSFPFPGYVEKFWYAGDSWYAERLRGLPIAEYIWLFLTGAFIGPLRVVMKKST